MSSAAGHGGAGGRDEGGAAARGAGACSGIAFDGAPGPLNAITDVAGLEVGHATIVTGEGAHAVRTGVTAVLPRGKRSIVPVFAGWSALNGNGEMTGTTWVEEGGILGGPVMLTNTNRVGVVRDAVIAWAVQRFPGTDAAWDLGLPVVAETYDGFLSDIDGFHVTREHAFAALDGAAAGPVAEGGVGGGTGMMAYEFKAGIGTSSRMLTAKAGGYTVGVLVQANYGKRGELTIAGVPVGREITDWMPSEAAAARRVDHRRRRHRRAAAAAPTPPPRPRDREEHQPRARPARRHAPQFKRAIFQMPRTAGVAFDNKDGHISLLFDANFTIAPEVVRAKLAGLVRDVEVKRKYQ